MYVKDDTVEIDEGNINLDLCGYDSRESVLNRLDEVIEFLHKKALSGRITKPENEKVRIQWFKALAYTCSIYNQIKRDAELDQVKDELQDLKDHVETLENQGTYG